MLDLVPAALRQRVCQFIRIAISPAALTGCTVPDQPTDTFDPFEAQNREVHEFNRSFDSAFLRPASEFYGGTLPEPIRYVLNNLADNIAVTGDIVNDILQLQVEDAVHNTVRFAVNTTIGIGGIFDPATPIGLDRRETGFGETLHTWGVPEGAYVELAFVGPSTEREAVGVVADFFTNALSWALDGPSAAAALAVGGVDIFNDRYEFGPAIDDLLYGSEDSYAAARTLYLQNLRFRYSGGEIDDQVTDIYDDLYAE